MKIAPAVGVLLRSMQDEAIRNGTIIALVIVVLQLATRTWLDQGTTLAFAVATGFTLLFVIAWQRILLSEWRRYKVALALLVVTQFVVTWK